MLETLIYGLQVALVGIVIVFIGLVILVFLFKLMSLIVRAFAKRKAEKEASAAPAVSAPPAAPAAAAPVVVSAQDDDETVAVIAAAVASFLGTDEKGLIIRSIRRVGVNAPSWNAAGRSDIIQTRN